MQLELYKHKTWLHDVNPSFKLGMMVILFVTLLFIHNLNIMINLTLLLLLLYLFLTGQTYRLKLMILIPFSFMFFTSAISMILFGKGETTWFQYGLIHITEESFYRGVHLGLRSLAIAFFGLIFVLTTKPVLLFYSLMQQWKLPAKYAYSFMAGFRLIPLIGYEFLQLRNAWKIRGVKGSLLKKIYLYSIPLLSQSIRRAHRIAVAMEAKKFNSTYKRTYYYKTGYSYLEPLFILLFLSLYVFAVYLGMFYPYIPVTDVRH
ncbi:Putative HMP/thiamine permease protein YkoC [Bacillus sp. THAF10]|uniref:energy-coupling factor transporter transmembrane component T family protein n=1 Tax=Bacillus sp. THAF10 TaxID=2587848 RepID=UPI001267F5BE|nr:energy-coupling factor transporter transmembrane component T [Bacillus sp. THAF10]QFT88217.1 Putative HMP/thiamine permease protein YkoC [Bacillus sp. THAF10]